MSCHHLEDRTYYSYSHYPHRPSPWRTHAVQQGTLNACQPRVGTWCGHLQHVCAVGLESVCMCVPSPMNMFFLLCVLSIWVYGRFQSPSLCASYWFFSTQPLSVRHTVSNSPALHLIAVSHTYTHVHTWTLCPPCLDRRELEQSRMFPYNACTHAHALYARAKQGNMHTPNKAAHGHRGNQAERAAN